MKQEEKLLRLLKEHSSLGIANQIDYQKFYLYSLITHSTAIEGSTVTEIENQLLFESNDRGDDTANDTVNDTVNLGNLSKTEEAVLAAVGLYPAYTYEKLAAYCNLSRPTVARAIKTLQGRQLIRRVGSDKTGHWEVVNGKEDKA